MKLKQCLLSIIYFLVSCVVFSQDTEYTEVTIPDYLYNVQLYNVLPNTLEIHSTPSLESPVITEIPAGETVYLDTISDVLEFQTNTIGQWIRVVYGTDSGWVLSTFLSRIDPNIPYFILDRDIVSMAQQFVMRESFSMNFNTRVHGLEVRVSIRKIDESSFVESFEHPEFGRIEGFSFYDEMIRFQNGEIGELFPSRDSVPTFPPSQLRSIENFRFLYNQGTYDIPSGSYTWHIKTYGDSYIIIANLNYYDIDTPRTDIMVTDFMKRIRVNRYVQNFSFYRLEDELLRLMSDLNQAIKSHQ